MVPEFTYTTDHRHFFSGNLTLKGSTAIHKENTSVFVNNNKKIYLIFTYAVNDKFSRNLISSEKNVFLMTFGRLRLSQNKFVKSNQTAIRTVVC